MEDEEVQVQKASQKSIEQAFAFSEYINTVKLINSQQEFKQLKPLGELLPTSEELKSLTPNSYRQLAIQFFYLLYSCSHKQIVPVPQDNSRFLCYSSQSNTVLLILTQFVTYETSVIREYQTSIPYFEYYRNFITAMVPFWKQAEQRAEPKQASKREYLTSDYFIKKLNAIKQNQAVTSQKQAFSTFQKEQIFVQTSILLRIVKSSLVCVITKSQQLKELYKKHRNVENKLVQEYNERRKRKNNMEKTLDTEKNIQKNIEDFFMSLKSNPRYYKVEDKRKKESTASIPSSKILIGLKVFQSISSQQMIDQDYYNIYEIEYHSAKNLILVRMITDIVLDWSSSDSILFKWNTLTFQTSNVGLETIEKLDEQKKPKKFVVIRGTCYFTKKQPILQKVLTLIDITMATYKSIQLEMKSETVFAKNINKIDESYQKINHYLTAIHKCCLKSYAALMVNQQSEEEMKF